MSEAQKAELSPPRASIFDDLIYRLRRLPRQLRGQTPFAGDIKPTRVPLFAPGSHRPSLPFPHPWNYHAPIDILETFFWGADAETGSGRHSRYLEVPGFSPVLVTRDPRLIRAITHDTGDKEGQFNRDTLPTTGIARATGKDTLLYSNGTVWRNQKKLSAAPFGKTSLFQPEQFHEFAGTFRQTVIQRLEVLQAYLSRSVAPVRIPIEPEIKAVMLEMLTNNFFGCNLSYEEIRNRFMPAIERVIDHIVRDTVLNRFGIPIERIPSVTKGIAQTKQDYRDFNLLTDLVLAQRPHRTGLWKQFKSDVPDKALRSNIKVFLAGALEATTSYASWAIAHLARNEAAQEKVYQEVREITDYTPDTLDQAVYLSRVLEETLRLTPALYFLPRSPSVDKWVETSDGSKLWMPRGTHILLDVWHANRHEDHWGVSVTGYPATEFVPERWENLPKGSKEHMHFGFGNGPRVCPGKHLGQLETALVVGAFVKLFRFRAVNKELGVRAGVSTKPADGVLVELARR